jgi:hypothetical protein
LTHFSGEYEMQKTRLIALIVLIQILIFSGAFWVFERALARAGAALTASTPHLISYQGVLADSDGNPINGERAITMTVYDAASGGAALWSETHASITFSNGSFSALLGSVQALPDDLFDQPGRWLEIRVDGVTLSPRQQFTAAPYALNAEKLDGRHADELTGDIWMLSGTWVNVSTGVLLDVGHWYSSNASLPDFIHNFEPHAITKTVQSVNFLITSRSGAYSEPFILVFEARDFEGNLKRTLSAASIDLQTAPLKAWVDAPLSADTEDLIIFPGEYLAAHVSRQGPQGGDFEVYIHYEAQVR